MFVFINILGFFQQAVLHHNVHSPVDAFVEFFPVTGQSDLDDAEGAFFRATGTERGVCFPGHVADFECMDYPFRIF